MALLSLGTQPKDVMSQDFPGYVRSKKTIVVPHDWDDSDRSMVWTSALDISGITVEGLQIRLTAQRELPDEAVMAQLAYRPPKGKPQQLTRAEWRPLSGHNNKGRGPPKYRLLEFRQTHIHRFDDNWVPSESRMFSGNLPIAIPVQDFDSYEKFLDFCAYEFNVLNMAIVPIPSWRPTML
jgi:hypothetical protein